MILDESFNPKRIKEFRDKFQKLDTIILEKMIYAMYLLEKMQNEGLDFIFKGGTALAILYNEPKRFSIDIDIMTERTIEELESCFDRIIKDSRFTNFILDEDRSYKKGIKKAHYFFVFNSNIEKKESHIMLDVIYVPNFYKKIITKPIKSIFLDTDDKDTMIKVPSFESITGDKLTVFAPSTSGYLYNQGLELQIMKQLFDIGYLFEEIKDIEEVAFVFSEKVKVLNEYFNLDFTQEKILDDIIQTCLLLSKRGVHLSGIENEKYNELVRGVDQMNNFLIKRPFHQDIAIDFSARVALIANKIFYKDFTQPESLDKEAKTAKYLIDNPKYNFLNKLKNLPGVRPLFYWYQFVKLNEKYE